MNDDAGLSISQFRDAWRLLCGAIADPVLQRGREQPVPWRAL